MLDETMFDMAREGGGHFHAPERVLGMIRWHQPSSTIWTYESCDS